MLNEPSDPSDKIKVVDRRRFTDSGELRQDWKPSPPPAAPVEAPPADAAAAGPPQRPSTANQQRGAAQASAQVFLELVGTLAQQAELLLTGAQGLPAQPGQAQRLIDYLAVLEAKTRGNLTTDESNILSNVIFELRRLYLQRKR